MRARRIDRRQRVADRSVDGAAQIELQGDLGVAERARRRHLGEPGNLAELLLRAALRPRTPWSAGRRPATAP